MSVLILAPKISPETDLSKYPKFGTYISKPQDPIVELAVLNIFNSHARELNMPISVEEGKGVPYDVRLRPYINVIGSNSSYTIELLVTIANITSSFKLIRENRKLTIEGQNLVTIEYEKFITLSVSHPWVGSNPIITITIFGSLTFSMIISVSQVNRDLSDIRSLLAEVVSCSMGYARYDTSALSVVNSAL